MSRRRIVVTGSTGFIGRRLCSQLSGAHDVFAVTRRGAAPGGVALAADLAVPFSTAEWPRPVDAVVHLAQSMRHREFPDGAADMAAINVAATASLLEYARTGGAEVFILASTGNVYSPSAEPLREEEPIAPAGGYAASKAAAECLVRPYAALLRVATLRIFYPYGPGQDNRLIPSLIARVRDGRPVSLAGAADGLLMTPTYVDDIVDVIGAAIRDDRMSGTFNVSAPWVMTLRDVGETIGRALGRVARFERVGGPEPPRVIPSIARLAAVYPIEQFVPLADGLARLLAEPQVSG